MKTAPGSAANWGTVVKSLGLKGIAHQLALNCVLMEREGNTLRLMLAASHAHMRTRNAEERLKTALEDYYGKPLRLHIQLSESATETPAREQAQRQQEQREAAVRIIQQDPNVQALCETFDGQVKSDSITPND